MTDEERKKLIKAAQRAFKRRQLLIDIKEFLDDPIILPDVYDGPPDYSEVFDDIYDTLNNPPTPDIIVNHNYYGDE